MGIDGDDAGAGEDGGDDEIDDIKNWRKKKKSWMNLFLLQSILKKFLKWKEIKIWLFQ